MISAVNVEWPQRNTRLLILRVFDMKLVVSYDTVVAAQFHGKAIRRKNIWGPTTGRHMTEWGVRSYDEIEDPEEFNAEVRTMLFMAASEELTKGF